MKKLALGVLSVLADRVCRLKGSFSEPKTKNAKKRGKISRNLALSQESGKNGAQSRNTTAESEQWEVEIGWKKNARSRSLQKLAEAFLVVGRRR